MVQNIVSQQFGGGKQRRSNLELYRIIVMLLIVAHHYVVNSGLLEVMEQDPLSSHSIYLYLLGMWGKTGINCFVLITGYFMCKSHITCRKFLKLLLEVLFYNIVCWTAFTITSYEPFSLKSMVKELVPIMSVSDGFTSCFLIFYLFIPFLNILVDHLDKKKHGLLLVLSLTTYTLLPFIPKFHVTFNYVTWFCILYFISSYIRLYGLCQKFRSIYWGIITLVLMLLSVASVLFMIFAHIRWGVKLLPYYFVADSNMLFAVLVSISSFMYFKDLHIKQSKIINTISASTFGVLCIHANSDTMRSWLWKDTLDNVGQYYDVNIVSISILSVLAVFFICIMIDYIRIHSIERLAFRVVDKLLFKYHLN